MRQVKSYFIHSVLYCVCLCYEANLWCWHAGDRTKTRMAGGDSSSLLSNERRGGWYEISPCLPLFLYICPVEVLSL